MEKPALVAAGADEPRAGTGSKSSRALDRYSPGLDGLRAVAMAVVLLYHSDLPGADGAFLSLSQFFTLSGFLITSILLRNLAAGRQDMGRFWAQRYRRLLPAAFATLAGVVLFGATVATEQQLEALPGDVTAALAQVANWHFIFSGQSYVDLFVAPSPVQHFWSLSVEEQFYVLLPISLLLITRRTRSLKVIGGVLAAAAVSSLLLTVVLFERGASIDRLYYGTDTRAAEILVGCVLAVVLHRFPLRPGVRWRRLLAVLGLVAFGATVWGWTHLKLTDPVMYRGGFFVFSLISSVLIISILAGSGPVAMVLGWSPLAAMGRITYGIYLVHWPIYLWLTPERTGLEPYPNLALRVAVTMVLAVASYHLLEMPIRNGTFTVAAGRLKWAALPAAVVIALGAVAVSRRGIETDLAGLGEPIAPAPALAATSGDDVLDVLVVADGESEWVVDELEQTAATSEDLTVTAAAPFSCAGVDVDGPTPTCSNWLEEWPDLVERVDPDVVLVRVTTWDPLEVEALSGEVEPDAQQEWMRNTIGAGLELLTANGATVLWDHDELDRLEAFRRQTTDPFFLAWRELTAESGTVRRRQFFSDDVDAIERDLRALHRSGSDDAPRVLVVGDSVARTLGYGLERWGTETGDAVVWSAAAEGCGVADEGHIHEYFTGREADVPTFCRDIPAQWSTQVEQFDPDLVIMLSTNLDLQERKLDDWSSFLAPGDPQFDDFLVQEYIDAFDVLSARGAEVLWFDIPCVGRIAEAANESAGVSSADRIEHVNDVVLDRVVSARPLLRRFEYSNVICPGGEPLGSVEGVGAIRPDGYHFSPEGSQWFAREHGADVLAAGLG